MIVEEKILEKIRKILYSDTEIDNYIKKRVYASHISSIAEPKYPAISLHLLSSRTDFNIRDFVFIELQIDVWMQGHKYTSIDCYNILKRIRSFLDRQNLNDSDVGIITAKCLEENIGNIIYEEDDQLLHLPIIYSIVAR